MDASRTRIDTLCIIPLFAGLPDERLRWVLLSAAGAAGERRREEVFTAEERALLRFPDLLRSDPGNIDPSDLDARGEHFDEE